MVHLLGEPEGQGNKKQRTKTKRTQKRIDGLVGSNHLHLQPTIARGGAGNRTQIETGLHDILERMPQRHVLPLHHTTEVIVC